LYGSDNVINAELHFFSNSKIRIDSCMNCTRPQLAIELKPIKKAFLDAKIRGVKLRYLTEITTQNISYCKEMISIVDELRHLDGIKGSFMVNESEYLAPIVLFERGKIASEIVCSNLEKLVEQQQYVFDCFWSRAIPVDQRIAEIEDGLRIKKPPPSHHSNQRSYETKVLENPDEIYNKVKNLIEDTDELLVCSDFDGVLLIYDKFFDSYKRVLDKYKNGEHKGIRWIGTIKNKKDISNSNLIEMFLDLGVQLRHVKTILPINFAIGKRGGVDEEGENELHATIEYAEGGNSIQSLLVSNDPAYIKHFSLIFEELWNNSLIL